MRHPLSTLRGSELSAGALTVGLVEVLVVEGVAVEAVPEDVEPAVAEGAQGGVVALAAPAEFVVVLASPVGPAQRAEGPVLDGAIEVAVAGEPFGDDEFGFAGSSCDGGLAAVGLEGVGRVELAGMVTDLACDPGGETDPEPWHAEVDLCLLYT